ncbi:hypothetical protein [Paludisphaera mucosa]|uniref:Uncharacterized protein n=1 Tax=Paludisphaera mucosa TaxID=3030827 RepID=A0ABT6FGL0_9BACT|nr:hypothetical protein [Paludisphaera mucosa]MDG3006705.1 hypothetical protein [Paludisphaera mucosa]
MSARLLTPRRLQALGMVVIGGLLGYAIAASWNRLAVEPAADREPPAAAAPSAGVEAAPAPRE